MKPDSSIQLTVTECTPQIIGKLSVHLSDHSRIELAALGHRRDEDVAALVGMAYTSEYAYAIMQGDDPLVMMGAFSDKDEEGVWVTWFMFTNLFYQRGAEATKIVNEVLTRGIALEQPKVVRVHSYRPHARAIRWFERLGLNPVGSEGEEGCWTILECKLVYKQPEQSE